MTYCSHSSGKGTLGISHVISSNGEQAIHPPVSRVELSGELGPFLLMFPLQIADGEGNALLAVGGRASALRGGRGACR